MKNKSNKNRTVILWIIGNLLLYLLSFIYPLIMIFALIISAFVYKKYDYIFTVRLLYTINICSVYIIMIYILFETVL